MSSLAMCHNDALAVYPPRLKAILFISRLIRISRVTQNKHPGSIQDPLVYPRTSMRGDMLHLWIVDPRSLAQAMHSDISAAPAPSAHLASMVYRVCDCRLARVWI